MRKQKRCRPGDDHSVCCPTCGRLTDPDEVDDETEQCLECCKEDAEEQADMMDIQLGGRTYREL